MLCPGLGQCLNQSTACNLVYDCESGSGFILKEFIPVFIENCPLLMGIKHKLK